MCAPPMIILIMIKIRQRTEETILATNKRMKTTNKNKKNK